MAFWEGPKLNYVFVIKRNLFDNIEMSNWSMKLGLLVQWHHAQK